jgi:hypothetical protein
MWHLSPLRERSSANTIAGIPPPPPISVITSHSIWMSSSLTDGSAVMVCRIGHRGHRISVRTKLLLTTHFPHKRTLPTHAVSVAPYEPLYYHSSFTRRNVRRSRLSIVDNIANFKMPLIDGAETVSTVLNYSKIRFRKLPEKLITFGRKKYKLLRIYIGLSMSVTLKSPFRCTPNIPQVVFDV